MKKRLPHFFSRTFYLKLLLFVLVSFQFVHSQTPIFNSSMSITSVGISCAVLAFIITYNWRNENELPEWMLLISIFLPLLATFLSRQSKKRNDNNEGN